MGSTVSTDKKAYAFSTATGKTAYVLFEEMYEKNCYPHTPSWSCVGLGYIEDVLNYIFAFASHCEGGMLQHRSGNVLPENYLQRWLTTLASPLQMPDVTGTLCYGDSMYSTLPREMRETVEQSIADSGTCIDIADVDGLRVSLYEDFDLLRSIYCLRSVGAWRFIQHRPHPMGCVTREDLGYSKSLRTCNSTETPPAMYRIGENVVLPTVAGQYRCAGWAYSVVGSFVRNYYRSELTKPGTFKDAFKRFRRAVADAPDAPDEMMIAIAISDGTGNYSRESIAGMVNRFAPGRDNVTVSLGQVRVVDSANPGEHILSHFVGLEGARWMLPSTQQALAW